jgi:hypothetical protein
MCVDDRQIYREKAKGRRTVTEFHREDTEWHRAESTPNPAFPTGEGADIQMNGGF